MSTIQCQLILRTTGYPERAAALRTLMPMAKDDAELTRAWHRADYWRALGKRWLKENPGTTQADADYFVTRASAACGLLRKPEVANA